MNKKLLTGKQESHLVSIANSEYKIHKDALKAFLDLQKAAKEEGFNLQVISSFRSFEHQLKIWNLKASGQRALLSDEGTPLEFSKLSESEILFSILRWSAVPGASRHHWGTELDIYDANSLNKNEVRLTPMECEPNGPCGPLHTWLDEKISSQQSFGFFRPYEKDLGGVSPEKWHLSYSPLALEFQKEYTLEILKEVVQQNTELLLKDCLLKNIDEIYTRFVNNTYTA